MWESPTSGSLRVHHTKRVSPLSHAQVRCDPGSHACLQQDTPIGSAARHFVLLVRGSAGAHMRTGTCAMRWIAVVFCQLRRRIECTTRTNHQHAALPNLRAFFERFHVATETTACCSLLQRPRRPLRRMRVLEIQRAHCRAAQARRQNRPMGPNRWL